VERGAMFACEPVERKPLLLDLSLLTQRPPSAASRLYCNLPEREAQCLSAANSPTARALEHDADVLLAQSGGLFHRRSNDAAAEVLRLRATHERNLSAAAGMILLLRLSEAESGTNHLVQSLQVVGDMLGDVRRLQAAGLPSPSGQAQLEAERLLTERRLIELQVTIDELNWQLATLMGVDLPPESRFWPDVDLKVDPALPAIEDAVGMALVQRGDLAAARLATTLSDREILRAAGALLGSSGSGIAASGGALGCLHVRANREEAALLRENLTEASSDQELAVRHEVARAVAVVRLRLEQVALSQQRVEVQRRRLQESGKKDDWETAGGSERHTARLDLLQAEQDLLHDAIEWKIAAVKLREVQGDLAIECGYDAVLTSSWAGECCEMEAYAP
jgi:outer membrane protein TolC